MTHRLLVAVTSLGLAAGFLGGLLVSGDWSVHAQGSRAKAKEPVANAEEFQSHVLHYPNLPPVELVKGSNSRLVAGEQSMISFLKMDKHSYFAPHRHHQEQIMIVLGARLDWRFCAGRCI